MPSTFVVLPSHCTNDQIVQRCQVELLARLPQNQGNVTEQKNNHFSYYEMESKALNVSEEERDLGVIMQEFKFFKVVC